MTSGGRVLVWFSCGAASACAARLAVAKYGTACLVVYCDTLATEHPDNARFMADVERWLGVSVQRIKSEDYASVDDVFERTRYMAGIAGARCTVEMKKLPRVAFQREGDLHIFGFTYDERQRAQDFEANNPSLAVEHILIDAHITKADCYRMLADAKITLPAMYALGFEHNNCLGCVKATSTHYWNLTRKHFPEVFSRRARQSRALGVRLARLNGERIFLDELPENADDGEIEAIDCGPACQVAQPNLWK